MFPSPLQDLINQLSKLPDIGPRAATRLAFYLLKQPQEELNQLARSIISFKKQLRLCPQCFNLTTQGLCLICQDKRRDQTKICVVESILDIAIIEKTKQYQGLYHVLGGLISPYNGIGPEQLKIKELEERIQRQSSEIKKNLEVILALNPTTEGDTTALYLEKFLQPLGIKITRLARGLSSGSSLEYIDENTLRNALINRR